MSANYTFKDASGNNQTAASDIITAVNYPYTKIMDGTVGSTNAATVDSSNNLHVSIQNTDVPVNVAQIGGSTISTAASGIQKVGITDSSGNALASTSSALNVSIANTDVPTNVAQIGGNAVAATGINGQLAVAGATASGSAITAKPITVGSEAVNAEQTAVSNGQVVNFVTDLVGKQIVMPYANKENFISGTASTTGTSGTSVISAQGAGVKIYITAISIANTGATTSLLTIQQDPAGTPVTLWQLINPAGGGDNITFPVPIVVAANKAVGFTAASGSTTQYVSISGYIGS